MRKFVITLTKKDASRVLETFNSKQEAMAAGNRYYRETPAAEGLLSCIQTECENSSRVDDNYLFLYAWL